MRVLERGMGVVDQRSQAMPSGILWGDQSDAQADVQHTLLTRGNSSGSSNARQQARCQARGTKVMPSFCVDYWDAENATYGSIQYDVQFHTRYTLYHTNFAGCTLLKCNTVILHWHHIDFNLHSL